MSEQRVYLYVFDKELGRYRGYLTHRKRGKCGISWTLTTRRAEAGTWKKGSSANAAAKRYHVYLREKYPNCSDIENFILRRVDVSPLNT